MLDVRGRRPRADGTKRTAPARGSRGARRQSRAAEPKRRPLRPVQLLPGGLPARREAGDARLLPAASRGGGGPDPGRHRGAPHRLGAGPRGGGRLRVECPAEPSPFRLRARRAVVLAGGAFGTPELLLRSGFASPSGQLGRNLRIHPACWVGARFAEQVRGWDGVMQSYAVQRVGGPRPPAWRRPSRPLAFGAQWLPGTGVEHQERVLAYDRIASTGVHLSDRSSGRVGPGPRRVAAGDLPPHSRGRRSPRLRDRARGGALLRRRGLARSTRRSPGSRSSPGPGSMSSSPRRRRPRRSGSRPFTRWEPRGWTPTPRRAWSAPTVRSTAHGTSTSPTAASCRARSASTR